MRWLALLLLGLCLALAGASKPLTATEVPEGWSEPEYAPEANSQQSSSSSAATTPTLVEVYSTKDSVAEKKSASSATSSTASKAKATKFSGSSSDGSSSGGGAGGEVQMVINGQRVSMYPAAVIPGPWFGSFSTRMDGMGYSIPPYAFDPNNYARLGPYRALTNKYSDGTSYPLNMQKYDDFPYTYGGQWAGPTTAEYVAPLSLVQEGEDFHQEEEDYDDEADDDY
jgi:hypothetical protein